MPVNYLNVGLAITRGKSAYATAAYINKNTILGGPVRYGVVTNGPSMAIGSMAQNESAKNPNVFRMGNATWGSHTRIVGT